MQVGIALCSEKSYAKRIIFELDERVENFTHSVYHIHAMYLTQLSKTTMRETQPKCVKKPEINGESIHSSCNSYRKS